MSDISLPLILFAAFVASASPGPATLAIAGTSMNSGRRAGLALASGITCGSLLWSVSAALGLGALMLANAWAFEVMRYAGAAYLMFLGLKSARSALTPGTLKTRAVAIGSLRAAYAKGLALHLTNPKPILFFGSLFAVGVPPGSDPMNLATIIAVVGLQSFCIFHGYALVFSTRGMTSVYTRLRRWFEAAFAFAFGAASLKILTAE